VLTVTDDGAIIGVRSTNGAPFRLYNANAAPAVITGCSEQVVAHLGCGSIIHGIQFDFDSAVIRADSDKLLEELSVGLGEAETSSMRVIGHTSSEGNETYNEELSQRRAEAVVAALVSRGIDAATISAEGRGEREPIADNAMGAGRALNRRVEISCQ
jgi:outer membrane protein OmpA-like peptidoglycan-associated protein